VPEWQRGRADVVKLEADELAREVAPKRRDDRLCRPSNLVDVDEAHGVRMHRTTV